MMTFDDRNYWFVFLVWVVKAHCAQTPKGTSIKSNRCENFLLKFLSLIRPPCFFVCGTQERDLNVEKEYSPEFLSLVVYSKDRKPFSSTPECIIASPNVPPTQSLWPKPFDGIINRR